MNFNSAYLTVLFVGTFVLMAQSDSSEIKESCTTQYRPINASNQLHRVSGNFAFLEGPTWSTYSNSFYFSEMHFSGSQALGPVSNIYQLTLPNTVKMYKENAGTNGLLAAGTSLYSMNHATRSLSSTSLSTGQNKALVSQYQSLAFNSPNDLVKASDGTIYFTDPDWQLGERSQETPYTGVYAFTVNGKILLIDKTLQKPNGIALSPDQNTLYVGTYSNNIVKYAIGENNKVGKKELFVNIKSPDGMAVDCAGNIYATNHTEGVVYVYSDQAKLLDKIEVGPKITNVAFGGKNMKTLLITTDHGLYTMNVEIAGYVNSSE